MDVIIFQENVFRDNIKGVFHRLYSRSSSLREKLEAANKPSFVLNSLNHSAVFQVSCLASKISFEGACPKMKVLCNLFLFPTADIFLFREQRNNFRKTIELKFLQMQWVFCEF